MPARSKSSAYAASPRTPTIVFISATGEAHIPTTCMLVYLQMGYWIRLLGLVRFNTIACRVRCSSVRIISRTTGMPRTQLLKPPGPTVSSPGIPTVRGKVSSHARPSSLPLRTC